MHSNISARWWLFCLDLNKVMSTRLLILKVFNVSTCYGLIFHTMGAIKRSSVVTHCTKDFPRGSSWSLKCRSPETLCSRHHVLYKFILLPLPWCHNIGFVGISNIFLTYYIKITNGIFYVIMKSYHNNIYETKWVRANEVEHMCATKIIDY